MQRTIKIIVVWMLSLFWINYLQAQSSSIKMQLPAMSDSVYAMRSPNYNAPAEFIRPSFIKLVPPDFYTRHFGFFCEKEFKLEKSTGIPFRFRLGSIENCNSLEGKK